MAAGCAFWSTSGHASSISNDLRLAQAGPPARRDPAAPPVNGSASTSKSTDSPGASPSEGDGGLGAEAALSRDMALYESGQYEECVTTLTQLLRAETATKLQRLEQGDQAKIYLGACLIARGRLDDADQVFKEAIRNNPQMRAPDNLVFPQTVVDRFLRVREQLLTDIRREERNRVQAAEQRAQEQDERRKQELHTFEQLKALARQEAVVEKNRRWLATVPFGVGQFQNGDAALGWVFLAGETALMGTCITAVIIDQHLANRVLEPGIDRTELNARRTDAHRVIVASSWGFLGVALGGIIHAHWRFVPERRTLRTRTLPLDLESAAPNAAGLPKGDERRAPPQASVSVMLGPAFGLAGTF